MWRSSRNYQEPDPVESGGSKTTPARHKTERYERQRNIRRCSDPSEGRWRPCQLRQGRKFHAQRSNQVSIQRREDTIFPSWKYFWDCCALQNFRIRLARHSGVPDGKNDSGTTEELPRPCPRQGLSSEGNAVNSPTRNRERDGRDTKIPGRHWTWRGNEKNVYGTSNPYLSVLVVVRWLACTRKVWSESHIKQEALEKPDR